MFVVCAGPWHSVAWEHTGPDGRTLPFGWHARSSLAAELDRDAEEIRRITEQCFDHYSTIFDEPYAFDSYDQVMAPGRSGDPRLCDLPRRVPADRPGHRG